MTAGIHGLTANYKFNLVDFDYTTWQNFEWSNWQVLDAVLSKFIGTNNIQGVWQNSTAYTAGQSAIDGTDGTIWLCQINNTSAASPTTFATDRAAHPTYWFNATLGLKNRGTWLTATFYNSNDFVAELNGCYVCQTAHTSGVFATDLAAGKWILILDGSTIVANATAQVTIATTQAGIATTQAGISTTQAGIATTQAGIATTQAGIATTQAGNSNTSAVASAASAALAAIQFNGVVAFDFLFDTGTTNADPGAGKFRLNNATQNTATNAYLNDTQQIGGDAAAVLAHIADSTNTIKGAFRIVKKTDPTKWIIGNFTNSTHSTFGSVPLTVTSASAANPFTAGDECIITFDRAGDKGAGAGNVNGPVSSIDNSFALFSGTGGATLNKGQAIARAAYVNTDTGATVGCYGDWDVDTTTAVFTLNAPTLRPDGTALSNGDWFKLGDVGGATVANNLTVATTDGKTIMGAATYTINEAYRRVRFKLQGTDWKASL